MSAHQFFKNGMSVLFSLFLGVVAMAIVGCGTTTEEQLEQAADLLDAGEYLAALAIYTELVTEDAENYDAVLGKAKSELAAGFWGDNSTALTVLQGFLEGQGSGSALEAILGVTPDPDDTDGRELVRTASETIRDIPNANRSKEAFLTAGIIDLATMAVDGGGAVSAVEDVDPCTYEFNNITTENEQRFDRALASVEENFAGTDIDLADTPLGEMIDNIETAREAQATFEDFLRSEFDATACPS